MNLVNTLMRLLPPSYILVTVLEVGTNLHVVEHHVTHIVGHGAVRIHHHDKFILTVLGIEIHHS